MDTLVHIVLPIHIAAAIIWIACAVGFHGFVEPASERNGVRGERLLLGVLTGPFTPAITIAALATMSAGSVLYADLIARGRWHSLVAGSGIGYSIGAAATLAAAAIACTITGPNTLRLIALANAFRNTGWTKTGAQSAALDRARRALTLGGRTATMLLGAALAAMCSAH